jgi:hypothetical protein
MKKFLEISGVVFWVQVFAVICIVIYWLTIADKYNDEVDKFTTAFIEEVFEQEDYSVLQSYFSNSVSNGAPDTLIRSLEMLGEFEECQSEGTVEATDKAADLVMVCLFQNSNAEFEIQVVKEASLWKIVAVRITSDIFNAGL